MATVYGINFRTNAGFVTDDANHAYYVHADANGVVTRAGVGPIQLTNNTEAVTFIGDRDRDSGIDVRLAGYAFQDTDGTGPFVLTVDLGANGDYRFRYAGGDADDLGAPRAFTVDFYDSDDLVTPLHTITATGGGFVDMAGTGHASAAAWVSSNATQDLTISSGIVVLKGTVSFFRAMLSHLSWEFLGGGGGSIVPLLAFLQRLRGN